MQMTQDLTGFVQRPRCGELMERTTLVKQGAQAAQAVSNQMLLSLRASYQEISRLATSSTPATTRMTVIPSAAEVMYAVFSVQSGPLQWRHVVPLCDKDAQRWLEDCIEQQRISIACCVPETNHVTVMQWHGAWPQPEVLLSLADKWPQLADDDRAMDFVNMIAALAEPSAIQSADLAYLVEEVQVVTHSNWLLAYLETRPYFGTDTAVKSAIQR